MNTGVCPKMSVRNPQWCLGLLLFILCLALHTGEGRFRCPSAEDIRPCVCRPQPTAAGVQCAGALDLTQVQTALGGHFETMPRLKLSNVHALVLPSRALGDLAPRRFYLESSNIRSIDADAFQGQDQLSVLVLAEDRLKDIPAEPLRRLARLQTLSLARNFLMRIEEGSVSNLTTLRFLVLAGNRISKMDSGAFPPSLVSLTLSGNHLNTFNGSLGRLGHLEQLLVADNRLSDLRGEFDGVEGSLKQLHLEGNQIRDISQGLEGLTSLLDLSLAGNRIETVPKSALSTLKKLQSLNLSRNYISEMSGSIFEKLQDLETLDLSGNYLKVVCPALKPLRKLQKLNLSDLNLRSLPIGCFGDLRNLKFLDLSHNLLTGLESIFHDLLPSLAYLNLSNNRLTALTYGIGAAKNLRELDISFNHFSFLKAHHLASNRELRMLSVQGNPWKCNDHLSRMIWELEQNHVDIQGLPNC